MLSHGFRILCTNLFPKIKPTKAEIALNKISGSSEFKFDVSFTPLEKLVGKNDLSIDLPKLARKSGYQLDPGQAFYVYYSVSQLWKDGEPVEVDKDCQRAIDIIKQEGQFKNRVFIVTGATAFEGVSYTFSKSSNLSAGLKANFKELLTAAAAGYSTETTGGMTKITDGHLLYVRSAPPRLVRKWVRSTAVGNFGEALIVTDMPKTPLSVITESTEHKVEGMEI